MANTTNDGSWDYLRKPGFEPRPIKIAIAGAGAAGICLALKIIQARKKGTLGPIDVVVYERDTDYGGTWHANRYPGCRCDIPSHVYQFGFAPYSDWPEFYSNAGEIKKYMHLVAQKYEVEPLIRLRHSVQGAIFNEQTAKWALTVQDGASGQLINSEVDIYVSAVGVLSQVNRPSIPGLEKFTKNPIIHTAEWPVDLDWTTQFKDERVAVVGIGSSGLQVVGAISQYTKSVDVYARSKFWVSPPLVADTVGEREWTLGNFKYSKEEIELFRTNPEAFHEHAAQLSAATMHLFDVFTKGSDNQKALKSLVRAKMEEDLKDKDLIEKLIPDWDLWCRRVTPCAAFIDAIHKPHVRIITDPIKAVTPEGITTVGGDISELDRIILATGFDTTFRPKYPFIGKGGKSLAEVWSKRPKAYMSVAVAGFPNMFLMCGPGTVFANGSLLAGIEWNADYIVSALEKLQKQDLKSMEVNQDAQDEYNEQQDALMKDLVFTDACSSWYKGGSASGTPDALYAGSTLQFMEMLTKPRWEDWTFTSQYRNRFSFLGNGLSSVEAIDGDRAHYLSKSDFVNPLKKIDLN